MADYDHIINCKAWDEMYINIINMLVNICMVWSTLSEHRRILLDRVIIENKNSIPDKLGPAYILNFI